MHVTIQDQETGRNVILCVDRTARHCEAIQASPEDLVLLGGIAKAMGAESIYAIIPEKDREKWIKGGWKLTNFEVVATSLK